MTDITKISRLSDLRNIGDAKARADIADSFDVTKNYSIGEMVLYDGLLYRFTSAHAAGAWNSSHVEAETCVDMISDFGIPVLHNVSSINFDRTAFQTQKIYAYTAPASATGNPVSTAESWGFFYINGNNNYGCQLWISNEGVNP